jgi:hypothetical protein
MNTDPAISEIRANIAFEHMLVAMLTAAAASGGASLFLDLGSALFGGRFGFGPLFSSLWHAISFACIAFLVGFLAIVVAGLPLFLALERIKLRKVWPYVVAAIVIELIVAGVFAGGVPMLADFARGGRWLFFLPGVLAAILFGRSIKPLWRAAERAETAPAVYRIH